MTLAAEIRARLENCPACNSAETFVRLGFDGRKCSIRCPWCELVISGPDPEFAVTFWNVTARAQPASAPLALTA